ncbi:putative ABC-type xenobiotic transporter [Helianthus annuus]|nr:putative ABC-type xenobiotic transporter [Helianthus annuus]
MITGERQAARIRSLYLKTILRQDVSFFDKETNTGEVVGRMSGDTVLIQDAMGEKVCILISHFKIYKNICRKLISYYIFQVGKFIQLFSTFVGGFVVALVQGWLLTLVMLTSIPPLVISFSVMAIMVAKMATRGQTAYAKAATVVEQTIGSIRTVASFTGEKKAVADYNKSLVDAYNSSIQESLIAGFGLGTGVFIMFCSYALAVWFGAKMILERGYTGGDVLTVVFAVLTGSMKLSFDQHGFQFCHSHASLEGPLSTGVVRDAREWSVGRVSQNGSGPLTHGSGPRRTGVVCRSVRRVSQNGSGLPTHKSGPPTHGSGPRRMGVVCRSVRRVSQNGSGLPTHGPPTHGSGLSVCPKSQPKWEWSADAREWSADAREWSVGHVSLGQASPCLSAFAAGQAAAFKMFETINRKPEIDAYDTKGKVLDDIRGDIELKDVYFSYPARPDEEIFSGFSLCISSGTTAALVGESGSGKSTVISLLERFYDPQQGEVLIDNINLKEFQLKWIREKIGLVSQEPVLFTSSIKDNILYGKDGASMDEIRVAIELANAAKFIGKLPQGLDTMVGEHGTQLSGGQKQRVAIARAILKDPRILLLDEATSALDAESERVVQEALDRIMVNRTTVIVAHRLSTVRNADMIAVIHRGKMIEQGSHSELVQDPEGAYSQLIKLQEVDSDSESEDQQTEKELTSPSGHKISHRRSSSSHRPSKSQSFRLSPSPHSMSPLPHGLSLSPHSMSPLPLSPHSMSPLPHGLPPSPQVHDPPPESMEKDLDESSKDRPQVPLRRLAYLNKPEIPVLIMGSIAAIINGTIYPMFSILLSRMIKTFYEPPHKLRSDSKYWSVMFLLLGLVAFVAYPGRSYLFAVAGSKLIKRIRSLCFEKVVNMEVGWFDKPENSSGAIGARLSVDAASVRGLVGDALAQIVQDSASVATGLVIAFAACWQLALIILAMIPLMSANGYVQMQAMKGLSSDSKLMYEEASQVANDAVGSIRTVASFCAEEKVMQLYRNKCEGPKQAGIKQGLITGIGFGASYFLLFCLYAASFYIGARFVESGITNFEDVFRVFFALMLAALAVSQSSAFGPDTTKAKSSANSVFAILDRESEIDSSDESGLTLETVKGEIEIRHVSFRYPTRPDVEIFRDLCLTIHSGKTVALVGESGSGKSTVIQLLQRFYNPDSGCITLDGTELHNFQLKWLRLQMGLVSQEPVLFNGTIRANIAYGKDGDATEAEILAASELANAHNFISGLHEGYNTKVGERGVQMSGGQKQRVAIARAIVKSPKILLLDEATSALDAESERVVQDALDKVMINRTTVVVAHRLSTIRGADVIAVVKNGVIVEIGKHEKLINIKDGFYASLVALHSSSN